MEKRGARGTTGRAPALLVISLSPVPYFSPLERERGPCGRDSTHDEPTKNPQHYSPLVFVVWPCFSNVGICNFSYLTQLIADLRSGEVTGQKRRLYGCNLQPQAVLITKSSLVKYPTQCYKVYLNQFHLTTEILDGYN